MKDRDQYPEYVPSHGDLWFLAHGYLNRFLGLHFCETFLRGGGSSGKACAHMDKFHEICELLGEADKAKILQETDLLWGREYGDIWHVYRYRHPDLGFSPADIDAVVRYARSIPEERWGVTQEQEQTPDLEAALRAAIQEQATGMEPEWAVYRPSSPPTPLLDASFEHEEFLRELAEMEGEG
jgi:hypothetical protein